MNSHPPETPLDPRLEQAADWHARLAGDDADGAVWLAFTEWLEADPRHRDAFHRVEEMWRALDGVKPADMSVQPAPATVVSLAARRPVAANGNAPSRRWFLGGAAAAAVALGVATQWRPGAPVTELAFATGIGERRRVDLPDGSSITLNSGTRLSVALSDTGRDVTLTGGEALFDVAKDPARPFTVAAGDHRVTVLGTAFNVRHLDGRMTVTVTRGRVEVADSARRQAVHLTPGQQVTAGDGQALGTVIPVDATMATAWTDGRLVFDAAPLSRVLTELSRHYPAPMRAEGAAAALSFSGVLRLGPDQAVLLDSLKGLMPVAVTREGEGYVLSMRP